MSSLRSLLKSGRISKQKPKSSPRRASATATTTAASSAPRASDASPTKTSAAAASSPSSPSPRKRKRLSPHPDDEDFFHDHLDDIGLVDALARDLSLRDVPQAMAHARSRMFTPIPATGAGLNSTRIAQILNFRRDLPGLVSVGHVHAILKGSPTTVEREMAELEGKGVIRRVRVPGRGEALIMTEEYEGLIRGAETLGHETKEWFVGFLRENPRGGVVGRERCEARVADELIRAGFLTGRGAGGGGGSSQALRSLYHGRPEDRVTLTSLESVSRAASGSFAAVGGEGALQMAGGSGMPRLARGSRAAESFSELDYSVAVPGHGAFLKLATAAVEQMVHEVKKSQFGEVPESLVRERWEGGVGSDEARRAKKARGEFAGVLPGRTRKWKEFWGVDFGWVLEEAVGLGVVEVFETGSVGRGVRKL